jgi:hypothetical protein
MAGLLDSVAAFETRVNAVGLGDKWEDMKKLGWTTYASFAFSSSYTPGAVDDAPFLKGVVVKLLGAEDDIRVPSLRRLLYESYTTYCADVKSRMERTDDAAPRKLVVPERESRRQRLAVRLPGIDFTDELDVAYSLVDRCVQMAEDDVLAYVPWDVCAKRSQELRGQKIVKEFKADAHGYMREREVPHSHKAELNSDLRIKNALQRRGIALDMANLVTFEMHEKLVKKLMQVYQDEPPRGYRSVDMDQLRRADEICFQLMIEATRSGVKPRADGTLPLDAALLEALHSHRFAWTLAPLPSSGAGSSQDHRKRNRSPAQSEPTGKKKAKKTGKSGDGTTQQLQQARRQVAELRSDLIKATARPKARAQRDGLNMPKALKGMAREINGRPICFGFNLNGCKLGEACTRQHVCCVPGCGASHPMAQHRA